MPPPPAKPEEAGPKPDGRTDKARAGNERPEELVPELIKFLQTHPEIKALPKAVQVLVYSAQGGRDCFCHKGGLAWPQISLIGAELHELI